MRSLLLLAALAWPIALLAQPDDLGGREICFDGGKGPFICITIDELRRQLPPSKVEELNRKLAELVKASGRNGLFSGCGSGRNALPPTTVTGSPGTTEKRKPKSAAELDVLVKNISTCASQVAAKLTQSVSGGQTPASWQQNTVAGIDKAMSECREQDNSMIAETKPAETKPAENTHKTPDRSPQAGTTLKDKFKVVGVLQPEAPPAQETGTGNIEGSLLLTPPKSSAAPEEATPSPPKNSLTPEEVNFLKELYNQAKTPGEKLAFERYHGMEAWKAVTGASSGKSPCPEGANCKPSCEEMQATWARFKNYCDAFNWLPWQCVNFLEKAGGCVSVTEILPTPDGSPLACPRWAKDDESKRKEAWMQACQRRSMIAIPIDDTRAMCVERSLTKLPGIVRVDPCNDPRAMPSPDTCPSGAIPPRGGPSPRPPKPPER